MPPKKDKKKGKKKQKNKRKQGAAVDAPKVLKELLKTYEQKCEDAAVSISMGLKKSIRTNIEEGKLLHKFLLDPQDRRPVNYWEDEQLPEVFRGDDFEEKPLTAKQKRELEKMEKKLKELESKPLVKLLPLIDTIRAKRYVHILYLHVWDVYLDHDDMMGLAGMLAKTIYPLEKIELLDCFVHAYSLSKFALTINVCKTLSELILDYNEFGDAGCKGLAVGLVGNRMLTTLSLCYCNLSRQSGLYLGEIMCGTPVRQLYVDGNDLEAEGAIALLSGLAEAAEMEAREKADEAQRKIDEELAAQEAAKKAAKKRFDSMDDDQNTTEASPQPPVRSPEPKTEGKGGKKGKKGKKKGKKKGGKKKGKKGKGPELPPVGPQIHKLHLADNGIDHMGKSGNIAPMRCMQLVRALIANSKDVQEIDLWGNDVGDLGSRQLLEGLMTRKESKLPTMGLTVGHRINQDTYDAIRKLAPGVKKKGGRRGRKKKK